MAVSRKPNDFPSFFVPLSQVLKRSLSEEAFSFSKGLSELPFLFAQGTGLPCPFDQLGTGSLSLDASSRGYS